MLTLASIEGVSAAFYAIEQEMVPKVQSKHKWRTWRYEELADLCGEIGDWQYDGAIRSAMSTLEARRWLRSRHRLWWRTDTSHRTGLDFTADPCTGVEWDRQRITERVSRDAMYLIDVAEAAEEMQPTFRSLFREVHRAAHKIRVGAQGLSEAGKKQSVLR